LEEEEEALKLQVIQALATAVAVAAKVLAQQELD
jgi:hypothetical protein